MKTGVCSPVPVMPPATSRKAPVTIASSASGSNAGPATMTLEAEVSNHSYGFGDKQGARLAIRP